jgi:hypothetical protein
LDPHPKKTLCKLCNKHLNVFGKVEKTFKILWKLKQTIVIVGLPRQAIKNEGCDEEEN